MLKNPLFVSIFVLLFIGLSDDGYAHHRPGHSKGGDDSTTKCQLNFCIVFDKKTESEAHEVISDNGSPYCHGTDKVLVRTGGGPGFRFDTNSKLKFEGAGGSRKLSIDLSNFSPAPSGFPTNKGVDLRIDKRIDGGLDLCSLEKGESGTVGLLIAFEVIGGISNTHSLIYGTPEIINNSGTGPLCGEQVTVRRIAVAPATWTIEGRNACLWDDLPVASGVAIDRGTFDEESGTFAGEDASFFATITAILP